MAHSSAEAISLKMARETVTLTHDSIFGATVQVNSGKFIVNGSQPISPVVVTNGATLSGSGKVGPVTIMNGILAPSVSAPATLSINGDLQFSGTSTLKLAVNGVTAGKFDSLNVTGGVKLGNSTLNLNFGPNLTFPKGTRITLIANDAGDAVSGTFNGVAEGQMFTPGSQTLSLSYAGGSGNDIDLGLLNHAPVIASAAEANPANAFVGQNVNFFVAASDADQDTLTYTWDFGDSTTGTGAAVGHVYNAKGMYTATVVVTDGHGKSDSSMTLVTVTIPLVGEGPDSDNDGFSDSFEQAAGTSPSMMTDTPTGQLSTAFTTLPPVKVAIKLTFNKMLSDSFR